MYPLLQRRIIRGIGGDSGTTFDRNSNESRESFLNRVFANLQTESEIALIVDPNSADEIVTGSGFTINGADGRCALDMAREIRRNAEQRNRDADSDFQYLD